MVSWKQNEEQHEHNLVYNMFIHVKRNPIHDIVLRLLQVLLEVDINLIQFQVLTFVLDEAFNGEKKSNYDS